MKKEWLVKVLHYDLNEPKLRFQEWLDHKNYGYLFTEQSPNTFAPLFKDIVAKRPDF